MKKKGCLEDYLLVDFALVHPLPVNWPCHSECVCGFREEQSPETFLQLLACYDEKRLIVATNAYVTKYLSGMGIGS